MPRTHGILAALAAALWFAFATSASVLAAEPAPARSLPPAMGPTEPKVTPTLGDDGLYHQSWFNQTFLDLREDFEEAKSQGKRFAVIFEQRGCSYCTKMHKEVLAQRYINDYVRENFHIVQLNMWGSREVTDFDGRAFPEKEIAERWGVMFTPTVIFYKDDIDGQDAPWGRPLEVARMSLGIGAGTFYDLFVWIGEKVYEDDRNFQRFHLARYDERRAMLEKQQQTGQ